MTTSFSEHRHTTELTFDPGSTAVLVIDMLNDFCDPKGAMPLANSGELYEPINRIIASARSSQVPVIWICDEHPLVDAEFDKRSVHCLKGTWGAQIVDAFTPLAEDYQIPKRRYSGFFQTDLDLRLRELGIKSVILVGVVTNICVRSTAHDAFFLGYNVIIPSDCVAATGEREQASSLYDIDTHFGTVTELDRVLAILG